MYQVTATFGNHSSTIVGATTMAEACNVQARLYRYYTMDCTHDNTQVKIELYCDTCLDGTVRVCKAPKRHARGYHEKRCYKVCPTCKGHYATRIEA